MMIQIAKFRKFEFMETVSSPNATYTAQRQSG